MLKRLATVDADDRQPLRRQAGTLMPAHSNFSHLDMNAAARTRNTAFE